jgi:hypothetical protein
MAGAEAKKDDLQSGQSATIAAAACVCIPLRNGPLDEALENLINSNTLAKSRLQLRRVVRAATGLFFPSRQPFL